jgi:hypothetical protein
MRNYRQLYGNLVLGNFPSIKARNASGPGATDGTPYDENFINDLWGFMQAALNAAGITPNGESETAEESQVLEALQNINYQFNYPVGSGYIQFFGDKDPVERGLPGQWVNWYGRADGYRLTSTALPSFTPYQQGANYSAGAYVLWHLPGTGYELWRAKAAITNAAEQLDPVLWEKVETGDIVERRHLQAWIDDDFKIGDVIEGGDYAGLRVSEVISLGGTFPSFDGGNRPPFGLGVAGEDWHTLTIAEMPRHNHNILLYYNTDNGGNTIRGSNGVGSFANNETNGTGGGLPFKVDPRAASMRCWRRVA